MARVHDVQFNIRSRYARERASELARATGMTTAQIVEDLRAYTPPRAALPGPGLERRGRLFVLTGTGPITHEQTLAAIDAGRREREYAIARGTD